MGLTPAHLTPALHHIIAKASRRAVHRVVRRTSKKATKRASSKKRTGTKRKKARLVKGSLAAKRYMAHIRRMRKK